MTVTLELSDSVLKALGAGTPAEGAAKLRLAAAVKLFELGKLSSGAAAELAGIHRVEFLERLRDYGVAAIQGTAEDLQHDLEALGSVRVRASDRIAFEQKDDAERKAVLDEMTEEAQKHGLGY
jgi:predicted HTH domain antitoxin